MMSRYQSPQQTRLLCAALALLILAISAYVSSGFHKHESRSNKVCSFACFENPSSLEAGRHVDVRPPVTGHWRPLDTTVARPHLVIGASAACRAPPLQS
jgi:hypothetical protein